MTNKMNHYWLISISIILITFFSGINIAFADLTTRVSVNSSGIEGNLSSQHSSISADGRYVAFTSLASNLITNDTNNKWDVFVHDRKTGITTRVSEGVSVDITGVEGNGDSLSPSISADGRYVAFHSIATNLVPGDTNNTWDVFVHDRQTKDTKRVSKSLNNMYGESNNQSQYPSISADGQLVSFHSYASNLVASDLNNKADIFVHDRITGNTTRVSKSSAGTEGNGDSLNSSISADGRYIAFSSLASNLTVKDTNGYADIFLHDRYTGAIVKISASTIGLGTNNSSDYPSVSYDGRYVAFQSNATNLVSNDTNARTDIFVCDRQTGTTSRVSIDSSGNQANNYSYYPFINADGRYVAFHSNATNLVTGDTNGFYDVFRHDRNTGITERISINNSGGEGNSSSYRPSMSSDGRYISFYSFASNLVAGDGNNSLDTFVRHPEIDASVLDISITGMNDRKSDVVMGIFTDQFLTVWESDGSIMGEIRGIDGSIIRDNFQILPAINSRTYVWPAVTETGYEAEGYFLVSKMVDGSSINPQEQIIGVRLSITGDIVGSIIHISDLFYQSSSTLDGQPDVICEVYAYISDKDCLVVWNEHTGLKSTILGEGIHVETGTLSSARLNITSIDPGVIGSPAISYTPHKTSNSGSEYLIVYSIIPDGGVGYIAHSIVNPKDYSVSSETIISEGTGATPVDPDIAHTNVFEKYLVVWDNGNIIGQFLSEGGSKIGNNFIINTPECLPPYFQICGGTGHPAVATYGYIGDFIVNYYTVPPTLGGSSNILGVSVDRNGGLGTEFVVFSDTGLSDLNPAVNCLGGCLISWEHEVVPDGTFDIYGKMVSPPMDINIIKEGTGTGTVTSSPAGINCGTDCSEPYTYGTVVILTATASPGSTFTGWSGLYLNSADCSDGIVTMIDMITCKATFAKTLFEETDLSIAYTGKWTNYICKACSNGAIRYASAAGARATLSFTGTGIRWIAAKSTQLGKGKVYIDGVNTALIDLYNPTNQVKQKVYETTGLTQGIHTIAIEVSGQKNPASTGVHVDLDYFEVVP